MTNTDDVLTAGDKYTWTGESQLSLQDFLSKYKPSMVQNDGTKPWIWVEGSNPSRKREANEVEALEEAEALLKETTAQVKAIQDDPSIPTRSNKKTGARSKKDLREEAQAKATNRLKEIAIKYGYVQGKWLIFAPPDKVDIIWSHIASSLVSGPLSSTAAWLAKVATSPEHETPNYQHIICVYIPDVFDRDSVLEVMKVLLRSHGATLSGVKADLYTMIGIDSKHPSGIPSTIWKNTALLGDTEIKALKEEFFTNLNKDKNTGTAPAEARDKQTLLGEQTMQAENSEPKSKSKPKPKLRKKAKDDFFASDDEDQEREEQKRKDVLKSKKAVASVKRAKSRVDEDDEEEQESKRKKVKTARE
ncbi:hypothetical protein D9756_005447 [Leucocoprinus leucothites]|uniref:Uncharacterized protein n=1 Tax=Leucocoprinus leucothites TaxID=201217 RepID=A0A8H5D8Z3_9AGAR|nr:hypothetical protein D9756_005447 [Leucoagaricus leucothites]